MIQAFNKILKLILKILINEWQYLSEQATVLKNKHNPTSKTNNLIYYV